MNTPGKSSAGGLINMAAFLPKSRVNGPGARAVVWVQGCPRRCPGCFNQDMLEFRENQLVSVTELAERILAVKGLNGVTFSGGEPFAQALLLAELAERLKAQGLTIVVFTGYTYQELKEGQNPAWDRLLVQADLLIAGPFREKLPSNQYLLGSENQELIYLTTALWGHEDAVRHEGHQVEITVDKTGKVMVTGLDGGLS